MITQAITIGLLTLFSAMMPGPDFAIVTKNTVLGSRRAGLLTSLGICTALLIHLTYCSLGLAIAISNSLLIFNIIKYIGAIYLIYLGINSLTFSPDLSLNDEKAKSKRTIGNFSAFRQGFLCNLLNPKATLFFLALFTMVINPLSAGKWLLFYVFEIYFLVLGWFCTLTFILSHPHVIRILQKAEKYIAKFLGLFLIGFGIALTLAHN